MMTLFICLVAVALIASAKLLKGSRETQNLVTGILGALLLLMVILRFTTCSGEGPPATELSVNRNWAVGWRLGNLVAEQFPEGGTIAVLQAKPGSVQHQKLAESQLEGVQHTLPEDRYQIVVHQPNALSSLMATEEEAGADKTTLKDSLKASIDAQAIVSFVHLPVTARMKGRIPPVYLLDSFATGFWVPAMKAGVVRGAVTTHRDSSKINFAMEDGPPQKRFDAIYQLFTPDNVDTFTK